MLPEIIYINRNGQMLGSFHRDAIKDGLRNHTYFPDDLAWYEGASGWAPLNTLEGFDASSAPPVVPPPVPSIAPSLPPPIIPPIPPSAPPPIPPPSATASAPRPPIAAVPPKKRGCAGALIVLALLGFLVVVGGGVAAYKFGLWQLVSLRLKAESGNTDAMVRLAFRYRDGHGVKQNFPEAFRWFRKASDAGNTSAEIDLADLLTWTRSGLPPPQFKEAMQLYLKACDQGDVRGCEQAASIYENGLFDFPKDANEAQRLYAKAKGLGSTYVPKPSAAASEPAATNPSSSTGSELPATDFYRAFTDKPAESDRLYKNKTITLVGAVELASVNPMGQVFVLLKAGGSDYVTCLFPATAKSTVTSLREGQNVKIRGACTGLVYGAFGLKDCTLVR